MTQYPWNRGRNTSDEIADQDDPRYETPGGAANKIEQALEDAKEYTDAELLSYVAQTLNLADDSVTRPKIAPGAVGATELDPSLLDYTTDIAVAAKFNKVDAQLADIGVMVDSFPFIIGDVDDSTRIQRAIASLPATGGRLIFSNTTYTFTTLNLNKDNVEYVGQKDTVLSGNVNLGITGQAIFTRMFNLKVIGRLVLDGICRSFFDTVDATIAEITNEGNGCYWNYFVNCSFGNQSQDYGLRLTSSKIGSGINLNTFVNCVFKAKNTTGGSSVYAYKSVVGSFGLTDNVFQDCDFSYADKGVVLGDGCIRFHFMHCYTELNTTASYDATLSLGDHRGVGGWADTTVLGVNKFRTLDFDFISGNGNNLNHQLHTLTVRNDTNITSSTIITYFPVDKIHYAIFEQGSHPSGFPTGGVSGSPAAGGLLITHYSMDGRFANQHWYPAFDNLKIYYRKWDNYNSVWGPMLSVSPVISENISVTGATIAANSSYEYIVPVTQSALYDVNNDNIIGMPRGGLEAGLNPFVTMGSDKTVKVKITNSTTSSIIMATRIWHFKVIK